MKKNFLALLALVALLCGCPTGPVDVGVPDAQLVDAATSHRVGGYNPTPSGTGVRKVVGGVESSAASAVSMTADVTGILPYANGGTNTSTGLTTSGAVVVGGTLLSQATDVLAGSGFVSIGTGTAPAIGRVRVPYAASDTIIGIKDSAAVDRSLISRLSANQYAIGEQTAFMDLNVNGGTIKLLGTTGVQIASPGLADYSLVILTAGQIDVGKPMVGYAAQSSPFSVHGKTTVATAPPFTLAAADYAKDAIMLSSNTSGTVTFPSATDATAYYKTVIVSGTTGKTLSNGGASTPVAVTGTTGRYLFDSAGVHLTGTAVAYP